MRYLPNVTFALRRSRIYLGVVGAIAIILIALCAYSVLARPLFDVKNLVLLSLGVVALGWLARGVLQQPGGQLHFAQGQWRWQCARASDVVDVAGTLRLHLDLQKYMLVSFVPHQQFGETFLKTTLWFHLEARQEDRTANAQAWLAVRRAVYSPQVPSGPVSEAGDHENRTA